MGKFREFYIKEGLRIGGDTYEDYLSGKVQPMWNPHFETFLDGVSGLEEVFDNHPELTDKAKVDLMNWFGEYGFARAEDCIKLDDNTRTSRNQIVDLEAENRKWKAEAWQARRRANTIQTIHTIMVIAAIIWAVWFFGFHDVKIDEPSTDKQVEAKSESPSLPVVPYTNGELLKGPRNPQLCPFSVETSGSDAYYVYLDCIGNSNDDMAFMVSPGRTVEVNVPLGKYEVYYASGSTWHGQYYKFGEDTRYYKCDEIFDFYQTDDYYQGWTITLYTVSNGNMDTDPINESAFPG